jgi:2-amino-4-hydroxy-6-hydroxymethyldihydropteridine diphosphokinase
MDICWSKWEHPVGMSRIYESEPWGFSSDHRFCIAVFQCSPPWNPCRCWKPSSGSKRRWGRQRNTPGIRREGYADRTIDIDLLLFAICRYIIHAWFCLIRHWQIAGFVLLPLYDIAPQIVHPVLGMTVEQMLQLCTDEGKVWPFGQPGK